MADKLSRQRDLIALRAQADALWPVVEGLLGVKKHDSARYIGYTELDFSGDFDRSIVKVVEVVRALADPVRVVADDDLDTALSRAIGLHRMYITNLTDETVPPPLKRKLLKFSKAAKLAIQQERVDRRRNRVN